MAMPEAAVDEDHELAAQKQHDVGPTGKILAMQPEADAEPVQQTADHPFWRRVLAADGSHDAGTASAVVTPVHYPPSGIELLNCFL